MCWKGLSICYNGDTCFIYCRPVAEDSSNFSLVFNGDELLHAQKKDELEIEERHIPGLQAS